MNSIEALWDQLSLSADVEGALRVDDTHPCDLYAVVDAEGRRGLVLVTDQVPPHPPALEAVLVTANRRHDGRFSLGFWLQTPTLLAPFAHLCQDLIDESRTVNPKHAGGFLLSRLARWRRLLKGEGGLQLSELRGFVGELVVLKQCLEVWPPVVVIESWLGPLDAAQDFILPSKRIEAKAVQPDARVVTITSADQLEHSSDMLLAVVTLVTLLADDTGVTPHGFVSAIRDRLVELGDFAAGDLFEGRLAAAGYATDDAYGSLMFRVDDLRYFNVADGFPAITRAMLPAGVADTRYDIELGALLPFSSQLSG